MKTRLKQIDLKYLLIGMIVLYIPFHILEEAYSNFPLWMSEHYNLPQPLSYPHWLTNNSIFLSGLLIGMTVFLKNRIKYLFLGFGILFWGFMNSMEHIVFSIMDNELSPGFYTALLFLVIFIIGLVNLYQNKLLNTSLLVKSFIAALSYWIIPILIIVLIGPVLVKVFP